MRAGSLPLFLVMMLFGATAAQAQYTAKVAGGPEQEKVRYDLRRCHDINRIRVGYTPKAG